MHNNTHIAKIILGVLFFLSFSKTYCQFVFKADALPNKVSLHNHTFLADVGDKELDVEYVANNFETLNPINFKYTTDYLGFTESHFWSLTKIVNNTNAELHYYLETARPITNLVELYIVDLESGEITKEISGDGIAYKDRSHPNRRSIFDLRIKPNANLNLFLHVKSDGEVLKLPLTLYSADGFVEMNSMEQFLFGIFYGILSIVAIIYLFFFFALNESTFLYYSLYVISVGLLQFALDGFFFQYVTPSGGWFSNHAVLFFAIIGAFLSGKYSEVFLNIKTHSKALYRLFNVSYILLAVLLFFSALVPAALPYCYKIVNLLVLVFLLLIIFSIVYLYVKKKPIDTFFTIGIFFLIFGFGVFILNNLGLIENTFTTQNSSKIGTGLELIFLSLSMSNLIRNLKNEKNELYRLALVRSQEMNDLKSYFLSNISHELRTPLNAIMNLIDSISTEVKDDNIKNNCRVIKYSSQTLLSSVNDILDFSKIEKNELQLDRIPFNVASLLDDIVISAQNRASEKGLDFVFSKPDLLPELLVGDEMRLSQIINNLINNAIKFTSEGFVLFKVENKKLLGTKVSLMLTVEDSGVGIAEDKIARIYDSFSQNSIDNSRKFGGLGLGLYIVKTLVDKQSGSIEVKSNLEKGTTFSVCLEFDTAKKKQEPIIAVEVAEVCDLGGKTILVVEDNSVNQMVIKMITKKWLNTTMIYVMNGQEGLDAFKDHEIDLVLMDLQMPVMDGYEATIAIRNGAVGANNASIPIIAVTADVMEGTKLRTKEIGMNNYISKPLKKELLYKIVKELI
ncbi:response regulator [Flavobacterium sp. F-380]|uniref:histidine kinase n=1 Tax=Flavobacterium kayseriense TaxID=2764714 RepID=A0ABR7J6I3_9FLAO|nr:hybrid sensor histidine kinase/response regulator [Flavobacterium kayseriense]MBC5841056.1 response regulator [Flavobacterium kayseriense]MBC5847584.1 response regulator [Flavobacterium kayseriense]MBU0940319.1 response regulator [Bacteroidota bacterium]